MQSQDLKPEFRSILLLITHPFLHHRLSRWQFHNTIVEHPYGTQISSIKQCLTLFNKLRATFRVAAREVEPVDCRLPIHLDQFNILFPSAKSRGNPRHSFSLRTPKLRTALRSRHSLVSHSTPSTTRQPTCLLERLSIPFVCYRRHQPIQHFLCSNISTPAKCIALYGRLCLSSLQPCLPQKVCSRPCQEFMSSSFLAITASVYFLSPSL